MAKENKVRLVVMVRPNIKEYYQKKSDQNGMSLGQNIDLALYDMMQAEQGLEALGKGDIVQEMRDLKKLLEEQS